ncbi:MAG: hypothetical protein ACK5L3_15385 [Oscillospiraceae bacterium]
MLGRAGNGEQAGVTKKIISALNKGKLQNRKQEYFLLVSDIFLKNNPYKKDKNLAKIPNKNKTVYTIKNFHLR